MLFETVQLIQGMLGWVAIAFAVGILLMCIESTWHAWRD